MFNRKTVKRMAEIARESRTYEMLTSSRPMRDFLSAKDSWSTRAYQNLLEQRHKERTNGRSAGHRFNG